MGIHPLNPHDASADDDRRTFLKRLAIGGAAAAVATQVLPLDRLTPAGLGQEDEDGAAEEGPELTADEETLAFLAGLSLATASAYRAAVGDEAPEPDPEAEAAAPSLPPVEVGVPEPVSEVLRRFGSHHNRHATAFNGVLPAAVETANATLVAELSSSLAGVGDVDGLLAALRANEERLAATHLSVLAEMTDDNDATLVVRSLPVLAQHAVVLGRIAEEPVAVGELIPETQGESDPLTPDSYPPEAAQPAEPTEPAGPADATEEDTGDENESEG